MSLDLRIAIEVLRIQPGATLDADITIITRVSDAS